MEKKNEAVVDGFESVENTEALDVNGGDIWNADQDHPGGGWGLGGEHTKPGCSCGCKC